MVNNKKELYEVIAFVVNNFLDVLEYTKKIPITGDFMNNGIARRVFVPFSIDDERNTDLDYAIKVISGLLPIGFCVIPEKTIEDLKYVEGMLNITVLSDHITYQANFEGDNTNSRSCDISEFMGRILFDKDDIERRKNGIT